MQKKIPTIGEEEKFYGYITGLGIENWQTPENEPPRYLYASFEYNGETTIWVVPDEELFRLLGKHLNNMAWTRKNADEYGYDKLWINKSGGKWNVELP